VLALLSLLLMYLYIQGKSCILAYATLLNNLDFSHATNIYTSIAIFFVMIYIFQLRLVVPQTLMKLYGKMGGYLNNINLGAITEFKFRQRWKCCAIVFGTDTS